MDISRFSVTEIKELAAGPVAGDESFLCALQKDPRAGVQDICRRLAAAKSTLAAEMQRLAKMFYYEDGLKARGQSPVAGVDEAGRGPLAGPVVAAAVVLPERARLFYLNDSKKLSAAKREALEEEIKEVALAWAIGVSPVEEILAINIHQAGLAAMRRAVLQLKIRPACVLVDGFRISRLDLPQVPLTGGDSLSASIAAASILAKVYRDRLMDTLHTQYPLYGFDRHRGYATPEHLSALARHGPCPAHRAGFQPVKDCLAL